MRMTVDVSKRQAATQPRRPALVKDAIVTWVSVAVAFAMLCMTVALAQDHGVTPRSRAEAVISALASGQAEAFESAAQANFSTEALARRTPEQRADLVSRVNAAFGRFEVGNIAETPDGLRIEILGASGTPAVIVISFEPPPADLIAGIAFELDAGPPPPEEVADADRAYTTSDLTVPAGDHVLSARLYAPLGRGSFPVVVLMPGSGSESVVDESYTRIIAQAFASHGIGSLAYDKAGVGRSTGQLTGSDFEALGADAAAVVEYARSLSQTEHVGLWGISQAGWFAPTAVRGSGPLRFAIIVSPGGVNPFEQVSYFLHMQALSWGLSPADVEKTDRMHRAVALYYAGRASYRSAQAEVDRHRDEPWFQRVITHPYWDEIKPDGRILAPQELADALSARPEQFEIYRAASSFHTYRRDYESLRLPTLVLYGSDDQLVPVARSRQVFERAFAWDRSNIHEFEVFQGASHDIRLPNGNVASDYLARMALWARARFDEVH